MRYALTHWSLGDVAMIMKFEFMLLIEFLSSSRLQQNPIDDK